MTTLELYRKFEKQLLHHRLQHGVGNPNEFALIDNMEKAWYSISPEEQQMLDAEPPQCFPSEAYISYKASSERLLEIQKQSPNDSTPEEEILLDKMDILWHNIREEEKEYLSKTNS